MPDTSTTEPSAPRTAATQSEPYPDEPTSQSTVDDRTSDGHTSDGHSRGGPLLDEAPDREIPVGASADDRPDGPVNDLPPVPANEVLVDDPVDARDDVPADAFVDGTPAHQTRVDQSEEYGTAVGQTPVDQTPVPEGQVFEDQVYESHVYGTPVDQTTMPADDRGDGELAGRAPVEPGPGHADNGSTAAETAPGDHVDTADHQVDDRSDAHPYVVDDGVTADDDADQPPPSTPESSSTESSTMDPALVAASAGSQSTAQSTAQRQALWGPETEALRERWRDIQLRFVDDPRSAAGDAASLADEACRTLIEAIEARRSALTESLPAGDSEATPEDPAEPRNEGETERLRVAVQRYREFLDQILTL